MYVFFNLFESSGVFFFSPPISEVKVMMCVSFKTFMKQEMRSIKQNELSDWTAEAISSHEIVVISAFIFRGVVRFMWWYHRGVAHNRLF